MQNPTASRQKRATTTPHEYVYNVTTGEVYRSTPEKPWTRRLTAWQEAMRLCGSNVTHCRIASPVPRGHVMFRRSAQTRPAGYRPLVGANVYVLLVDRFGDRTQIVGVREGVDHGTTLYVMADGSWLARSEFQFTD